MLERLQNLATEYGSLRSRSQYDDISDLDENVKIAFLTKCRAAIESVCDSGSAYGKQKDEIIKHGGHPGYVISQLLGVIKALISDIDNGYLSTFKEIIHADVFADYLEKAAHLSDQGYKDSAAVIAGSSLEVHIEIYV